jgi:hypothetical protein
MEINNTKYKMAGVRILTEMSATGMDYRVSCTLQMCMQSNLL